MEFEGYLLKWTNYISGWKERYFSLSNGVLYYSSKKNSPLKGQIHLKISKITQNEQDPLRIIIDSGTKLLHLKTETISEKMRWFNALQSSKEEIQEIDQNLNKIKNYNINPALLEEFIQKNELHYEEDQNESFFLLLDKHMKEIISKEAQLDNKLTVLANKFDLNKDKDVWNLIENIVELASGLIKSVTICVESFDKEKRNISKIMKKIHKHQLLEQNENPPKKLESQNSFNEISSQISIIYEEELQNFDYKFKNNEKQEEPNSNLIVSPSFLHKSLDSAMKFTENYKNFLMDLKTFSPQKYKILRENSVFKNRALPLVSHLNNITPHKNEDISFVSLIKSFVGKEFENLPIPIHLHEPISLLQKSCEQFKFSNLLNQANDILDPCIRLAYVMAFVFSMYSTTIDRMKKPFTPLLGETYEFDDIQKDIKFLAEQVTPQTSAIHCENKNFTFWNNTKIKIMFWGKNIEFKPIGITNIKLNKYEDHFVYSRCVTSVENLMIGSPYIDNYGDITFKNLKNEQSGKLTLKKRGFNNKNAYETEGSISDDLGNIKFLVKGEWNNYFSISNSETNEELFIWKNVDEDLHKNPYHFSDFTKELNNLNQENILFLPLTDSRFRSDQRALEYGLIDLAIEEHNILIEKQMNKTENWKPKWFEAKEINGLTYFDFNDLYWEMKKAKKFDENLNIFF